MSLHQKDKKLVNGRHVFGLTVCKVHYTWRHQSLFKKIYNLVNTG